MEKIFWIGGSKGGVGKSAVSMALLDHLGESCPLLVETDTANPDVAKAYGNAVRTELLDLDESDGWIELINLCSEHAGPVVINSAARSDVAKNGMNLDLALPELGRELVVFWVINRQRDSIELLRDFLTGVKSGQVHVVRNLHFGASSKFELFEKSKIRQEIENAGGKILDFPDLADRVADDLYTQRLSIARAGTDLPIGNRVELLRWRQWTTRMFREVGL